jgi:hypothetical protein
MTLAFNKSKSSGRNNMLALYISLVVVGVMMAVVGPRSFALGTVAVICVLFKGLKVIFDVLDVLELIINILSLFG